jgi:hypothetical protein
MKIAKNSQIIGKMSGFFHNRNPLAKLFNLGGKESGFLLR